MKKIFNDTPHSLQPMYVVRGKYFMDNLTESISNYRFIHSLPTCVKEKYTVTANRYANNKLYPQKFIRSNKANYTVQTHYINYTPN